MSLNPLLKRPLLFGASLFLMACTKALPPEALCEEMEIGESCAAQMTQLQQEVSEESWETFSICVQDAGDAEAKARCVTPELEEAWEIANLKLDLRSTHERVQGLVERGEEAFEACELGMDAVATAKGLRLEAPMAKELETLCTITIPVKALEAAVVEAEAGASCARDVLGPPMQLLRAAGRSKEPEIVALSERWRAACSR